MTSQHRQQLYDGKVFSLLWLADVTSASGGGDDGDSASSRQLLLSTGPDGVVVSNTLTPQLFVAFLRCLGINVILLI